MLIVMLLLLTCLFNLIESQCYEDSDLSLYQTGYPSVQYQEGGGSQCIPDYSVLCEDFIRDDTPGKGITCSRKGSTSPGIWTDTNGTEVVCDDFDNPYAWVHCTRPQPGSITLLTDELIGNWTSYHNYTCCIDGLCAAIRILNYGDFRDSYLDSTSENSTAQLETCIIVPPSDITAIPQQYLVQMNTSVIPFSRLSSFINCTDGDGITCGQSYYTLIDLNEERYQMTVPVTWSTDSTTNTDHYYSCRVRFGALESNNNGFFIDSKERSTSIQASSAPSSVSYEVVNDTAGNVSWSISGDVNGFIINITSDGLDTVTIQLTDGSLREYVINGLLPLRNYTVEVRGYYELLGPAITTTVRIQIDTTVTAFTGTTLSTSSVQLSWQPIPSIVNVSYQYEVAYAVIDSAECTGNSVSLPNEYTVYSPRTSNSTIEVLGLMSGTCYVFGVRVHVSTPEATSIGEFATITGLTASLYVVKTLFSSASTSVSLAWSPLMTSTDGLFIYEVAYIARPDDTQCSTSSSSNIDTLPDGYTLFGNTTDNSITVTGLQPGTCHYFGVRAYAGRYASPGQWTLSLQITNKASDPEAASSVFGSSLTTGLVVSLMVSCVITLILLFMLLLSGMMMLSLRSRNNSKENHNLMNREINETVEINENVEIKETVVDEVIYDVPINHHVDSNPLNHNLTNKETLNETVEIKETVTVDDEVIYDVPNHHVDSSTDNIEMHDCQPYHLSKGLRSKRVARPEESHL